MHRCILFVDEHHHLLASLLGGSHDDVLEASAISVLRYRMDAIFLLFNDKEIIQDRTEIFQAVINDEISGAISQACSEIIDGKWHENSIKKAIFATDSYFGESWSMTITPLKR